MAATEKKGIFSWYLAKVTQEALSRYLVRRRMFHSQRHAHNHTNRTYTRTPDTRDETSRSSANKWTSKQGNKTKYTYISGYQNVADQQEKEKPTINHKEERNQHKQASQKPLPQQNQLNKLTGIGRKIPSVPSTSKNNETKKARSKYRQVTTVGELQKGRGQLACPLIKTRYVRHPLFPGRCRPDAVPLSTIDNRGGDLSFGVHPRKARPSTLPKDDDDTERRRLTKINDDYGHS